MGRHIKTTSDGSVIEYDRGSFDDWCVYLTCPGQPRFPPRDSWYFAELQRLGGNHGNPKLYGDFVVFYDSTGSEIDPGPLADITNLSTGYGPDAYLVDILFSVIYAGMVAEERKANTRLGKRVKRLGMHQSLIEGMPATHAASFSRGMRWQDIDAECRKRGF